MPQSSAGTRSRRGSILLRASLDSLTVVIAYGAAEFILRGTTASTPLWSEPLTLLMAALLAHLLTLYVFGVHRRMWRHAGVEEVRLLLLSSVSAMSLLATLSLVAPLGARRGVSLGVILFGGVVATIGIALTRFSSRVRVSPCRRRAVGPVLRVAVIGSRDAGASAVRDMLNNPRAGLMPVGVFDDDARGHGLSLRGVPVIGPVDSIPGLKASLGIEQVVLAIPSPSPELIHGSLLAAEAAGVTMKLLPGTRALAGGQPGPPVRHPREFRIEDLLGRAPVTTDLAAVGHSLSGQRVLITGAGGSIGTEIARQVSQFDPELIILLDRDETHLHDAASGLSRAYAHELVDIRQADAVFDVFHRYRPSVVFHAAAHKHVPILEAHPLEAAKTNVFGTLNVVQAAATHGTGHFVLISTDKAVRPASVMGATKLIGERLLLIQPTTGTTFCAVRFGNVLGSRGSVIPTFSRQIASGGPVTVTDPLMTRFFMSLEEAVQLVLQASQLAAGGDIFMLDMGDPVSILDLARRMIRLSGYTVGSEIEVEFVGGRPGERLSEELCSPDEERFTTSHASILRLEPPALPSDIFEKGLLQLHEALELSDPLRVRQILFSLAGPVSTLGQADAVSVTAVTPH